MKTYDVLIIGAGIMGTFHAYHALKKGLSVALFEKNHQPQGATVKNFGQVVPSGMNRKWQRIGRRSLEIYKEVQNQTDITVRTQGTIYFASDEDEWLLLEEMATINEQEGYTSELWEAKRCLAAYPGLKASYCKGGLFFPEEVNVDPRQAVHRIITFMQATMNLDYFPQTLILGIEENETTCQIRTQHNTTFQGGKVIICNGSDFQYLFPNLFAQSDLEVSKLHMMQTVPQPSQRIPGSILTGLSIRRYESFSECPSYSLVKAREQVDPRVGEWGIHILFKQAEDGSVIIGDSHEYADAAQSDILGFDLRGEINDFMLAEAQRIFDLQTWQIRRTWYGVYSQGKTSDIFQYQCEPNVHIVTGIGGKGMTASPAFAEENINRIFA